MKKPTWKKEFNKLDKLDKEYPDKNYISLTPREKKILKSFISRLLVSEEANWMAEIHEQIQEARKELIEEIEKTKELFLVENGKGKKSGLIKKKDLLQSLKIKTLNQS